MCFKNTLYYGVCIYFVFRKSGPQKRNLEILKGIFSVQNVFKNQFLRKHSRIESLDTSLCRQPTLVPLGLKFTKKKQTYLIGLNKRT